MTPPISCCLPMKKLEKGEREIQHAIVDYLRHAGWYVRVLSAAREMPAQFSGLPDVVAFRHGHTLLVEVKGSRGRLRGFHA